MTYIIIGMFGIVIILLIVVILRTKRSNNNDIVERLGKLETNLTKDILEPGVIVAGVPAKVIRKLTNEEKKMLDW